MNIKEQLDYQRNVNAQIEAKRSDREKAARQAVQSVKKKAARKQRAAEAQAE